VLESTHPDLTVDVIAERCRSAIAQHQQIAAASQSNLPDLLAASHVRLAAIEQLLRPALPDRRWGWARRRWHRAVLGRESIAQQAALVQALGELTALHRQLLVQTGVMSDRLTQAEHEAWHLSARLNAFEARSERDLS
jgi:hypothetical protein